MNNTTANSSESDFNVCSSITCFLTRGERDLIIVSLFSVAVVSLAGNIPILISILFSSKRRNSSNLSTVNLIVSDVLMTIFCIPFVTLDLYVFDAWVFGSIMCRLVTFVQNTAINASLMNLLIMTCEKFLAVRFPYEHRLRRKVVCYFIPVTWIIAIAHSIFYVHFKRLKRYGEDTLYCIEDWPDEETLKNALIVKSTMFFFPLVLICTLHLITIYTLYKVRNTLQFQPHRSKRNSLTNAVRRQKRQRQAVKIILVTLVSIIVCWGPFHILSLIVTFGAVSKWRNIHIGYAVCVWLLFFHCSVFPFIYFFLTQKGKETIEVCSFCLRTCRVSEGNLDSGSLSLYTFYHHKSRFRVTERYVNWRRGSTAVTETHV